MNSRINVVLMAAGLSVMTSAAQATLFSGNIYFTTFNPTIPNVAGALANVGSVGFSYNDVGMIYALGSPVALARTIGADGIVFDPNTGHLLVGGQGGDGSAPVHEVNQLIPYDGAIPSGNVVTSVPAGAAQGAYHLSVSPDGSKVYAASIPGDIGIVPLPLGVAGTPLDVTGDVTGVDTLVFTPGGAVFYTSSPADASASSFGTIDLATGVTTQKISGLEAHGAAFDPYTGDIFTFGGDTINQIDPANPTVILATLDFPDSIELDQGTVDGFGHLFAADNFGQLIFVDYSGSGLINAAGFTTMSFLAENLDDIAPLIGPGGPVPEPGTLALISLGLLALRVRKPLT